MRALFFFFLLSLSPLALKAESSLPAKEQRIDLKKIFTSSPFIYSSLGLMSVTAMALWLYTLVTFRARGVMPSLFCKELRAYLEKGEWEKAKIFCTDQPNILSAIVNIGLTTRNLGPQVMIDAMKAEGKRMSTPFWQRLTLLSDIAIIAPMLGLLGTVIGMFYAFYDLNRSVESINALFDGLGIAVGTTVMGLIVAILSMIFATTLKYRLVKTLTYIENEALSLSTLIPRKNEWN